MIKIGAITVGQSPRTDVTMDIRPILGPDVELLEVGGPRRPGIRGTACHGAPAR